MSGTKQIDELIASLQDWRGKTMIDVRKAILSAGKGITEEWKFMGTPTFYGPKMICTADAFKTAVKVCFLHGASIKGPLAKHFNDELGGNQRRAIKYFEGDKVNAKVLAGLVKLHIALDGGKPGPASKAKKTRV